MRVINNLLVCQILLLLGVWVFSGVAEADEIKIVKMKQPVKTDYFEVIVHSKSIYSTVNTGNEFSNLPAEEGTNYLIIDVSFKNIDKESRMVYSGIVILIDNNGESYEFDHTEVVLAEGFGLMFDTINPFMKKRTKLVYKIPQSFKGKSYYEPGRNSGDVRILLGSIK